MAMKNDKVMFCLRGNKHFHVGRMRCSDLAVRGKRGQRIVYGRNYLGWIPECLVIHIWNAHK